MRDLSSSVRTLLFAFASYTVLTLVYFFPVLGRWSTHLIGPPEDNMQFLWFLWYGTKALAGPGMDFFHTRMMYFPEGMNLYFANYFYTGVFAAFLLKPFFSLVQTYNLLIFASFALSGLAAFYLIYEVTKSRAAGFIGGFVYAFNPLHFAKSLHHAHLSSIEFIPLFILFLLRSRSKGSFANVFMTGLFLALSGLCDWNYLVYGLLILCFDFAYSHIEQKKWFLPSVWLRVLGAGLCAFTLSSFILIPMIISGITHGGNRLPLPGIDIYVADLAGFVIPHTEHPLAAWLPQITALNALMTGNVWEKTVYLGLVNLLLAGIFLTRQARQARYFGWMLGFSMLLAMGVRVHFLGAPEHGSIPLPYHILQNMPFLKYARNPARIMAFGYLFLSVLVGGGVSVVLSAVRKRGWSEPAVAAALFLLIFLDFFQTTRETTPVELPKYFGAIRQDYDSSKTKPFGIINIPWEQARFSMYQTQHEIPDAQGYLGHKLGTSLIGRIPFDLRYLKIQKQLLTTNHVKYVIIHKKRLKWDPKKPEDIVFYLRMSREAKAYAKVYDQMYDDSDAAVFRVYP